MIKLIPKKTRCFVAERRSQFVVGGRLRASFWCAASPRIRYSIFRKSISMKMVWGQTQPQKSLPKAAVKRMMKTIKVTIVRPKMKKSCGQNTFPKRMKRAAGILNRKRGRPLMETKGRPKNSRKKNQLIQVRIRYHFPRGFWAKTHLRRPFASRVAR